MQTQVFDAAFFEKLNTLKLNTSLVLERGMGGPRKSSAKGSSVEFSDYREYLPGDDVRRIDWNAYGRTERFYVKQFMEEKEGSFHLFLDCSSSMEYGEVKKSVQALQIAGAISYLVINNMDRIQITTMQKGQSYTTKGMTGRQAFLNLIQLLSKSTFDHHMDFSEMIKRQPFTRKGTVFLISDFFDMGNLEQTLKYLAYQKQEIVLVHTLCREEIAPKLEGTLSLMDMEHGSEMKVTMTEKVLKGYEKTLKEFTNRLQVLAKKYRAVYVLTVSDEPLEQFIHECVRLGKLSC